MLHFSLFAHLKTNKFELSDKGNVYSLLFTSSFLLQIYSSLAQSVERAAVNRVVVGSSPTGGARKNSCSKEQEFFQLYSPAASYIELRSVIFASQVIFASRVLVANIISLLRKQKYHYAARHNITLCKAQNITYNLYLHRFYAIIRLRSVIL